MRWKVIFEELVESLGLVKPSSDKKMKMAIEWTF